VCRDFIISIVIIDVTWNKNWYPNFNGAGVQFWGKITDITISGTTPSRLNATFDGIPANTDAHAYYDTSTNKITEMVATRK